MKKDIPKDMRSHFPKIDAKEEARRWSFYADAIYRIITRDPFEPEYFKASKQLLDISLAHVQEDDLMLPLTPGTDRQKIEVAIRGGLDSIDLTFDEKRVLHAMQTACSDEEAKRGKYPEEMKLTRAGLYDLLGIGWITRADGTRYRAEAMGYQRKRIEKTLLGLSDKPFPFIFQMKTGVNKKGEPLYRVALTNQPIVRVAKVYDDVEQQELPGVRRQTREGEKRFSHYLIRFNPNAIGEVGHYFRDIPRLLGKKIADYRRGRGGKPSAPELNFIEFLYAMADPRFSQPGIIEINFLKLAKKLKIKRLNRPGEVRKILSRCYETAQELGCLVRVEEDQPGTRDTKEVFYLNVERFPALKRRGKPGQAGTKD